MTAVEQYWWLHRRWRVPPEKVCRTPGEAPAGRRWPPEMLLEPIGRSANRAADRPAATRLKARHLKALNSAHSGMWSLILMRLLLAQSEIRFANPARRIAP